MANYNYRNKAGKKSSWIESLKQVNPVSSASSGYTDIHFTKPKVAVVSTMTHPHVTFVGPAGTAHWYLHNSGGTWTFNTNGATADDQANIANNVLADALELNWIRQAETAKIVDEDGFTMTETKKGRKKRMQTTF